MEKFQFERDLPIHISDYEDESYYPLLTKLPVQLALYHVRHIENENMSAEEAYSYLSDIIAARQEVVTESTISDERLREMITDHQQLFRTLETSVFYNPDNYLGTGMTAKVKLYELTTDNPDTPVVPMAVKYVVTPTSKTLTAEREHGVIKEVERMSTIERAELAHPRRSKYIRVPHPYLHHATDKLQLYAMERIDGMTIEQACTEGMLYEDMRAAIEHSPLAAVDEHELDGYIERFFQTMHGYCLHGDIKPRNIMISREGVLYVIDFGQSVMTSNFDESQQDALENLKDGEIKQTQLMVKELLRRVRAGSQAQAA